MIPGKRFTCLFHLGNSLKFNESDLKLNKRQLSWTRPAESTEKEKIINDYEVKPSQLIWKGKCLPLYTNSYKNMITPRAELFPTFKTSREQ